MLVYPLHHVQGRCPDQLQQCQGLPVSAPGQRPCPTALQPVLRPQTHNREAAGRFPGSGPAAGWPRQDWTGLFPRTAHLWTRRQAPSQLGAWPSLQQPAHSVCRQTCCSKLYRAACKGCWCRAEHSMQGPPAHSRMGSLATDTPALHSSARPCRQPCSCPSALYYYQVRHRGLPGMHDMPPYPVMREGRAPADHQRADLDAAQHPAKGLVREAGLCFRLSLVHHHTGHAGGAEGSREAGRCIARRAGGCGLPLSSLLHGGSCSEPLRDQSNFQATGHP